MRRDEDGEECPATLGEYLDLCMAFDPECRAVEFLEEKIAECADGRDVLVLTPDSQMRFLLFPMMAMERRHPRVR